MLTADDNNEVTSQAFQATEILCFQIDIIIRFNCYKQSDHILLNQEREFSADAVWPLQIQIRFTMACC